MKRRPRRSTLFPYTTLSRSSLPDWLAGLARDADRLLEWTRSQDIERQAAALGVGSILDEVRRGTVKLDEAAEDRKSTRLNSSHGYISNAVFCLKKKKHTQCQ